MYRRVIAAFAADLFPPGGGLWTEYLHDRAPRMANQCPGK